MLDLKVSFDVTIGLLDVDNLGSESFAEPEEASKPIPESSEVDATELAEIPEPLFIVAVDEELMVDEVDNKNEFLDEGDNDFLLEFISPKGTFFSSFILSLLFCSSVSSSVLLLRASRSPLVFESPGKSSKESGSMCSSSSSSSSPSA